MSFIYPIGLIALASLIIPILIHLWNIKPSKTLKIGSIAFLGESATSSARNFKITDWFLFILRCLLIILVVFLLAQPYLKQQEPTQTNAGWILIQKEHFKEVYKNNQSKIDSLLAKRYKMVDFNYGFSPLELKDTILKDSVNTAAYLSPTNLLNQLNTVIPSKTTVYLFAPKGLNQLSHSLPEIDYHLKWIAPDWSDSSNTWTTTFAKKQFKATSNAKATTYTSVKDQSLEPLKVGIYDKSNEADGKFLKAALSAIEDFSQRPIQISNLPSAIHTDSLDVVFWLSTEKIPTPISANIRSNGSLFVYEAGDVVSEQSSAKLFGQAIEIYKRIKNNDQYQNVWTDAQANPILAVDNQKNIKVFHFYNRLNSTYTDLVYQEAFIKLIFPLLIDNKDIHSFGFEDQIKDKRTLGIGQNESTEIAYTEKIKTKQLNKNFNNELWLLAFIILFLERVLSFRIKANG